MKGRMYNDNTKELQYAIAKTFMKETSLTEKNHGENGEKKIYEGDIIRCYGGTYSNGKWEYDDTVKVICEAYVASMALFADNVEIVGTIFDKK